MICQRSSRSQTPLPKPDIPIMELTPGKRRNCHDKPTHNGYQCLCKHQIQQSHTTQELHQQYSRLSSSYSNPHDCDQDQSGCNEETHLSGLPAVVFSFSKLFNKKVKSHLDNIDPCEMSPKPIYQNVEADSSYNHKRTSCSNRTNETIIDSTRGKETNIYSTTRNETILKKYRFCSIFGNDVSLVQKVLISLTLLSLCHVCQCLPVAELAVYDPMCQSSGQRIPVVSNCKGYVQCITNSNGKISASWIQCIADHTFDPSKMECVLNGNNCMVPKDVATYACPNTPLLKFPHPSSCALFYDCSRSTPLPGLEVFENECLHPLVFDDRTLACVEKVVGNRQQCEPRPEPKGKCDYRLGCRGMNCSRLDDGFHHDPLFPFTENFYVCKNKTLIDKKACEEDGHIFDPLIRECTDAVHDESVHAFCTKNPSAIFPDASRCSLLYDCSQATWHNNLKPYQTECSYPRLFDTKSLSCANFRDVRCGHRQVTIQPCDYLVGHCIDGGCIPCVASCLGLRDGLNAYPGRVLTAFYLVCQSERTIDVRTCPEGAIFDPQMRACLNEISPQTLEVYCSNNPNGRLLHPSECSIFYSCNHSNITQLHPNLPVRAVECKYPYLVDAGTVSCKPHTLVRCGARREPFSPCDYVSSRCTSKSCTRCELIMPSCYGKTNSYYPAINQEMTSNYIICKDQRVMGTGTCPNGTIFDIRTLTCTDTVYPLSLVEYCTNYRTGRVQNPSNCAQYYDCAVSLKDVKECTYPNLYDVASHLCLPYDQVDCAGRPVYLEPCDSFTFCAVQPCPYCNSAYPSCIGRNGQVGGFHFEPAMYYECVDDRLKLKYCQTTFNATAKTCNELIGPGSGKQIVVTTTTPRLIDVGVLDSPANIRLACQLNPHLIHPVPENCAQFYNCSRREGALADFTDECPVGQLFDPARRTCLPFGEVNCRGREEPLQVCDYQSICSNKTSGGCASCLETYPSCHNRSNGAVLSNGVFSNIVIYCLSGRAVNVTKCAIGQFFDPIRRHCTSVLNSDTARYACKQRPNKLLPHPVHCARFVRCGPPVQPGRFESVNFTIGECPYPLLFSDGLCRSYKMAACGSRKVPVTPCEYEELRQCPGNGSRCIVDSAHTCPDKPEHTCTPCEQRYPSCLGSPDGFVPYPDRLFTSDFVNCDQQRTLSILKCVQSIFDPDARQCGLHLDTVMTEAQRHTTSFCGRYPKALIPHPTHCARYYNCSAPSAGGVSGVPHLQECPHPQLFNSDLRSCQNFIEVLNTAGCGKKLQPKHYCDYASICPSQRFTSCAECRKVLPSCENQTNGIHGNPPGNTTTRGFMYCVEGRVLATTQCPAGTEFHQSVRSCVARQTGTRPGRR